MTIVAKINAALLAVLLIIMIIVTTVPTTTATDKVNSDDNDLVLPNSTVQRLTPVTNFSLSTIHRNHQTAAITKTPIILPLPPNSKEPQPFTLEKDPRGLFGDEVSLQFTLSGLAFDLVLFKSVPFLNPETSIVINGEVSKVNKVGEIDWKGDYAQIFTYQSQFYNSQAQLSFATFTFSLSHSSPEGQPLDTGALKQWQVGIGGSVADGSEIFVVEPLQIHNYFILTDKHLTNMLIREEEYVLQSYEIGGPGYNATEHELSQNTLGLLKQDQLHLQHESDRLTVLSETTSQSLLAFRVSDVLRGDHLCKELLMPEMGPKGTSAKTLAAMGMEMEEGRGRRTKGKKNKNKKNAGDDNSDKNSEEINKSGKGDKSNEKTGNPKTKVTAQARSHTVLGFWPWDQNDDGDQEKQNVQKSGQNVNENVQNFAPHQQNEDQDVPLRPVSRFHWQRSLIPPKKRTALPSNEHSGQNNGENGQNGQTNSQNQNNGQNGQNNGQNGQNEHAIEFLAREEYFNVHHHDDSHDHSHHHHHHGHHHHHHDHHHENDENSHFDDNDDNDENDQNDDNNENEQDSDQNSHPHEADSHSHSHSHSLTDLHHSDHDSSDSLNLQSPLSSQPHFFQNTHTPTHTHSPLSMTPSLSRWTDCHSRAKLLTGLKVNFLISAGASTTLTGLQQPTPSQVLTSLQTLISQANGPMVAQLGLYIVPSHVDIRTESNSKIKENDPTAPTPIWNFDSVSQLNNGCPAEAGDIIPMLKSIRETPTSSSSSLPPAALTHLLHSCYASGIIGQGYVGAVRSKGFSVSWTSLRSKDPSWITLLHEISHGIGGTHPWGSDNSKVGIFGGVLDYGQPEGQLKTGPYAGSVGFNIDTDYGSICKHMQGTGDDDFWVSESTRPDLFSVSQAYDMSPYTWICSPDDFLPTDTIFLLDPSNLGPGGDFGDKNGQQKSGKNTLGHIDLINPTHHYVSNCNSVNSDGTDNTYSPCKTNCGSGTQSRSVVCANSFQSSSKPTFSDPLSIVDNSLCLALTAQPSRLKVCYGFQCGPVETDPSGGENGGNSGENVTFSWKCAPTQDKLPSTPSTAQPCSLPSDSQSSSSAPQTNPNTWSLCNAECGNGTKSRVAKCASSNNEWLPDAKCSSTPKPATLQTCSNMLNCVYAWKCAHSSIGVSTATAQNTGSCDGHTFFTPAGSPPTTKTTCAGTCGPVDTYRSVFCTQNGRFSADSVCASISSTKPSSFFAATCPPCDANYENPSDDGSSDGGSNPTSPSKPDPGSGGKPDPKPETPPKKPSGAESVTVSYLVAAVVLFWVGVVMG